jgi:anthraniloyl-CoA monooxygenase
MRSTWRRRSASAAGVDGLPEALARYEATRSVEVLKIQNAARNSTEWFENVERYAGMAPEQFAYSLLTRSQRISHENLRVRDAQYVDNFEQWLAAQAGVPPERWRAPPAMLPCRRCSRRSRCAASR